MDLEIPSTDRRLHTVPVATCLGEGPSDGGLRGAVEAQDRSTPLRSALQYLPNRRSLECARPQALKLARRTWQHHDHGRSAGIEHEPGRRSRQPQGDRAFRERRLLGHARSELGVRPAHTLGEHPRNRLDLLLQAGVHDERPPCDLRDHLHRSVVMRRAEPARDEAEIGGEALREGSLEVLRPVSDDRYPLGVETEPERLRGEKGAVPVVSLSADELRPRDDDCRPGTRLRQEDAGMMRRALTTNAVPAGSSTRFPFTRTTTFSGSASAS